MDESGHLYCYLIKLGREESDLKVPHPNLDNEYRTL